MKRDKVALYYSNTAKIISSTNDFIFEFGINIPEYDTETKKVDSKYSASVRIALSPQHLKAFASVVQDQLKRYEEKHGEICLPLKEEGNGQ